MNNRPRFQRKAFKVRWNPPAPPTPAGEVGIETGPCGQTVALVCRDGTRRKVGTSGFEGVRDTVCKQVGVKVVHVIEPREEFLRRTNKQHEYNPDIAMQQLDLILDGGETIQPEWEEKEGERVFGNRDIGRKEAARRYGISINSVCERTTSGGR